MIHDHTGDFPTAANAAPVQRSAEREACRPGLAESLPRTTLDALSAHIAVLDEDGGIIAVSPCVLSLWSFTCHAHPVDRGISPIAN